MTRTTFDDASTFMVSLRKTISSAADALTVRAVGVALGVVLTGGPAHAADGEGQAAAPNIVFIMVDDLGYTDVNPFSLRPDQYYETPNITRLAGQGMTFTNAYTNAANCAPSRAALMSGQYYPVQPIYTVNSGARGKASARELIPAENETTLPTEKTTIAEQLSEAGYSTAFMGKWHLGAPGEAGPRQQGFDVNVGGTHSGHPSWEGAYFQPNNNPEIDDAREGEYMTDYLFRKADAYIRRHRDEPFYLQLSPYSVHVPLQAPDSRIAPFKEKSPVGQHNNPTYAAMIKSVDRGVGRIMRTLDSLGLKKNTLLIFYSDNGGLGGYRSIGLEKNGITDHAPLKGGKGSFYEGGIRVPHLAWWPGRIEAGTTTDAIGYFGDYMATFAELAETNAPTGAIDSQSLVPVLRGDADMLRADEPLYWEFYAQGSKQAVRRGKWKAIRAPMMTGAVELYDLEADLGESNNVADAHPEVVEQMGAIMEDAHTPSPGWSVPE